MKQINQNAHTRQERSRGKLFLKKIQLHPGSISTKNDGHVRHTLQEPLVCIQSWLASITRDPCSHEGQHQPAQLRDLGWGFLIPMELWGPYTHESPHSWLGTWFMTLSVLSQRQSWVLPGTWGPSRIWPRICQPSPWNGPFDHLVGEPQALVKTYNLHGFRSRW